MSELGPKASRKGRYRKVLVEPGTLSTYAAPLEGLFRDLFEWTQGDIGFDQGIRTRRRDAEFVAYGLMALLRCRRWDAFQSHGPRSPNLSSSAQSMDGEVEGIPPHRFVSLLKKHGLPEIADEKAWCAPSLSSLLVGIRFRGLPDSVRLALMKWLSGEYPLTLFFHIPTSEEVFELQKQGGRCITFFRQAHELMEWHHGRDAISFVVHDLIHAHEFYSVPNRARQQIGFYHWLDQIRESPGVIALRNESNGFRERWEYVMADMNSYCGHLLKTLHAAFIQEAQPGNGETLWREAMSASKLSPEEQNLFCRINSPEWSDADFIQLEKILDGFL